jgi:hypothetical protein
MFGSVTEFDAAAGLGVVTGEEGRDYRFQCVEIADGSRSIEVGRPVVFELLPRFGEFQAGALHKL